MLIINILNIKLCVETYKSKLSLNCGDQLLLFDFVDCFLFLLVRCGPIRFTSTYGLNMPVANCHFKSFAATTKNERLKKNKIIKYLSTSIINC